jgi:AbrB family looped-hinge helix DNA binding protein
MSRRQAGQTTFTRTITTHRQLTLPAALCRRLGLQAGAKLAVAARDGRLYLTPLPTPLKQEAKP